MNRTPNTMKYAVGVNRDPVGAEAEADLIDTLRTVAPELHVSPTDPDDGADLMVSRPGSPTILIQVKTSARPTPAALAATLKATPVPPGTVGMLVADSLMPAARQLLREAGWSWLDRSGHLRLWADPLMIDTPVDNLHGNLPRRGPLDTAVGRELALIVLAEGGPVGVREAARRLERSPSAVSETMRGLTTAALVDNSGRPLIPELFWALAGEWGRMVRPVVLARRPDPGTVDAPEIGFGFDAPEETVGWALRGPSAAAAWGAPAPLSGSYPPDFFVPDERTVRIAAHRYGRVADGVDGACTVAVAPTRWICGSRVDMAARKVANTEWPAVQPVVAALDLALDPRGREILEEFDPPEGWRRVW